MEECDLNEIYDRRLLVKGTLASYILLVVYIPIGLALLALRLLLSFFSSLFVALSPALRTSSHFAKMYANLMGVHVQQHSAPLYGTTSNVLFVSNQRSDLDLLAVKSCIPHCDFLDETEPTTSPSTTSSLARFILGPVSRRPYPPPPSPSDFFKNAKNYPIVVFAEQMPSRARKLLAFHSAAFHSDNQPAELQLQPLTVQLSRPGLPLSVNHPNGTVRTLLTLFSPVNAYHLTFLPVQADVQACREAMAAKLGASLSSLTHEDVTKALLRKVHSRSTRNAAATTSSSAQSTRSTMSFNDTSRLALQIKDILPHASYELIQRHIRAASTLDIDTVLASILDDEQLSVDEQQYHQQQQQQQRSGSSSGGSGFKSSMSSPILQQHVVEQNKPPSLPPSSASSSGIATGSSRAGGKPVSSQPPNRHKSYEERKFDLLNEARRRYLQKNPLSS